MLARLEALPESQDKSAGVRDEIDSALRLSTILAMMIARAFAVMTTLLVLAAVCGCQQAAIQNNQKMVQQNQQQIEEMQKQLVEMQTQQSYGASAPAPGTPGTCDKAVMNTASRRGGNAYAAGDLNKALGFYQDAVTACPGSAKANLNVGRTYEALGNRPAAIRSYKAAANAGDSEGDSVQQAQGALSRLGVPQ